MANDRPPIAAKAAAGKVIAIRGAREHNLKNIDIDLPRDSLIVMTGPSGSGKSSLAFDTICAEGRRWPTGSTASSTVPSRNTSMP